MQSLTDTMTAKGLQIDTKRSGQDIIKLLVSNDQVTIKAEPNTVLPGSVFALETNELAEAAQTVFLQTKK